MDEGKTLSIVGLVIVMIIIAVIINEIFKIKYGGLGVFLLVATLFTHDFLIAYGDWLPIKRGMQINFDSGVAGTLRGELIPHPGGLVSGRVSIERRLVPSDVAIDNRVGGMSYLKDWFTFGNITIWVTGQRWQWIDIPTTQADNKNGAIRFLGNVRGEPLWNKEEFPLYRELENLSFINKTITAAMEEIESQAANMAAKQYVDIDEATQLAKAIADRMKNVRIVMRGRGGEGEAIAGEMASG